MIDLKQIRKRAGMTQEQLAERVGVIRQTISEIETGKNMPSIPTAQAIAEVLEFDWTLFFSDTEYERYLPINKTSSVQFSENALARITLAALAKENTKLAKMLFVFVRRGIALADAKEMLFEINEIARDLE